MAAPALLIGARVDQQIYLRGAGIDNRHATISMAAGRPTLKAFGHSGAEVNDKAVRTAVLQSGDVISIGQHRIRVMAAPPGFDFACELTRDDRQFSESFNSNWLQDVTVKNWTPRRVAYSLAALLLTLGLLWPFTAYLEGRGANNTPWQDVMTALATTREQSWRSDSLWSPGPLIAAHRNAIGNDCTSCHSDAFQPVADSACAVCHDQSTQHFDDYFHQEVVASSIASITTGLPRCENCHKEHNEPQTMIANSDTLCTLCHAQSFC
ncbi:MAG: cytochrome c3 family protein [Gammaproteobacteria bacterium]